MCFRVDCQRCGKYSWGGCGNQLPTLYASIDQGKHCMCRSRPGVVIPSQETTTSNSKQPSGGLGTASTTKEKVKS